MRTAEDYKGLLQALLPPGRLWDALRETGCLADDLLAALAEEFARVDQRCDVLMDETDPRTVYETLVEWENWAGLPDVCTGPLETVTQRRDALRSRLTSTGGQSRQYYINLADRLGYTITITEFLPPRADQAVAGDALVYDDWRHTWQVNAPATTIVDAVTDAAVVSEPLRAWGNVALECAVRRDRPAQTIVLFTYGG